MMHLRQIKIATAAVYDVKVEDLVGPSKRRVFVRPRQVAMFIARRHTDQSTPNIGRAFGGRDHTTVLHAERTIGGRMDEETRYNINRILEAVPVLREREAGGVFRSVRAKPQIEFQSTRTQEG